MAQTVMSNGGTTLTQVTEITMPAETKAEQPEGRTPATEKVTGPVNPLIGIMIQVELPATVARVVIGGQDGAKSTTRNVTEFDGTICVGVPPVALTVAE